MNDEITVDGIKYQQVKKLVSVYERAILQENRWQVVDKDFFDRWTKMTAEKTQGTTNMVACITNNLTAGQEGIRFFKFKEYPYLVEVIRHTIDGKIVAWVDAK